MLLENTENLIIGPDGHPAYIVLEYDLYLAHKAEIDAWRAEQRYRAKLIAEAKRNREAIRRDPSRLTSHAEIRRRIAEKQAVDVAP
jgi:hypothetical protein